VQGGVRYLWEHLAGINEYNAAGIGDVSYSTALALSSGVVPSRSVTGFTLGTFLPYGALSYALTKDLQLRLSAGEGYGGPGYDGWSVYQQNAAAFAAKGITANELWHSAKPEVSTQVDAGFRWSFAGRYGAGYIEPTGFYARDHNKLVSYDPGIGVQYGSNVGQAQTIGFQALGHYLPAAGVDLFAALGYQHAYFVQDLPVLPGASASVQASVKVAGRQLPDVPYWISTIGANLRWGDYSFTPILHIVGERAGDTSGFQPIAGYSTLNLTFGYDHKLDWGTVNASLSILNVYNAAYIGFINNSYYQQTSSTGIYFPGAPRTVVAKVGMKF